MLVCGDLLDRRRTCSSLCLFWLQRLFSTLCGRIVATLQHVLAMPPCNPAGYDQKVNSTWWCSQGVRDMVKKWLMHFCEIGGLMKRLDVGEGNYMKELEEDYDVFDSMNQVSA